MRQLQPRARPPARHARAAPHTHHQKSSTVSNVNTGRSVCPYLEVDCFCCGLSNHSVQACSSWCFLLKSASPDSCSLRLPAVLSCGWSPMAGCL